MASSGTRPGAGRPKDAVTRKTQAVSTRAWPRRRDRISYPGSRNASGLDAEVTATVSVTICLEPNKIKNENNP